MANKKRPLSPAEQSELAVLQAELDRCQVEALAERAQHARQLATLEARIAELEAELARSAAELRELRGRLGGRNGHV